MSVLVVNQPVDGVSGTAPTYAASGGVPLVRVGSTSVAAGGAAVIGRRLRGFVGRGHG